MTPQNTILIGLDSEMVLVSIFLSLVAGLLAGLYPSWRVCTIGRRAAAHRQDDAAEHDPDRTRQRNGPGLDFPVARRRPAGRSLSVLARLHDRAGHAAESAMKRSADGGAQRAEAMTTIAVSPALRPLPSAL